jgi:transposase
MLNTPYDLEARYSIKRNTTWTGYKVHLTETCDDDSPQLITHVETTPATTPDWNTTERIHPALAAKGLLPAEHLLDAGYVDADVVVTSQQEQGIGVVGPVPLDNHWQAKSEDGISVASFRIDWEAKVVTCPQGQRSRKWCETHDGRGAAIVNIRFGRDECAACEVRSRCTRSSKDGRNLTIRPQAQHEALQQARQYQKTAAFRAEYEDRAGVEGTLSQGVRVAGLRRSRYVGLAKTRLQHILTAAALNLRRVGEWYADTPRARTRLAPFVMLARRASLAPAA